MTSRRALIASLVAALGGGVSLRAYMHRFEEEVSGGPATSVLAWTGDADAGQTIERPLLAVRGLPRAYLESRHVPASELDTLVGTRLAIAVRAGETLSWSDLASFHRPDRQLSALVPTGMRAMRLEPTLGAFDSLLRPGDSVDVLLVRDPERRAVTVLERVLVLAVGDETDATPDSRRRSRASRVTLAVRADQSRLLAEAERSGPLRLVLRHPDDIEVATVQSGSRDPIEGASHER